MTTEYKPLETLDDVRTEYGLSREADYISAPGAMEGQPLWLPLAYQALMDGDGDDIGNGWTLIELSADDRIAWDISSDTTTVGVHTDGQGFISGHELTAADIDKLTKEVEQEQSRCPGCGELPVESTCTEHEYHCGKCHHGYDSGDID